MSFYRTVLAAVAAIALAAPVFADDSAAQQASPGNATATQSADASSSVQQKVDLNKATAKQLMQVKGLNSSKARAIVAYRKKHGDFKSVDDLSGVKGFKKMKPDTIKEIQDQLTVE